MSGDRGNELADIRARAEQARDDERHPAWDARLPLARDVLALLSRLDTLEAELAPHREGTSPTAKMLDAAVRRCRAAEAQVEALKAELKAQEETNDRVVNRLSKALREVHAAKPLESEQDEGWPSFADRLQTIAREALSRVRYAKPAPPNDDEPLEWMNHPERGMVTVWDDSGQYLGCMGVETWRDALHDWNRIDDAEMRLARAQLEVLAWKRDCETLETRLRDVTANYDELRALASDAVKHMGPTRHITLVQLAEVLARQPDEPIEYCPTYQDEYQRLWHESQAEVRRLRDELARLAPPVPEEQP